MDVVVQFAIHRLGFQPQDIILYAWSIATSLVPPSFLSCYCRRSQAISVPPGE